MSAIADVIGWKFNHQAGMSTVNGVITSFPGGIPTQADQDTWTAEYNLYLAKKNRNAEVNALRAAKLKAGVSFKLKTFDATEVSVGTIAAKYERLKRESAATADWTSIDNTMNTFTLADFLVLTNALSTYGDLCFRTARTHKNTLNALITPAEVKAYDITKNWPSNLY